MGELWRELVKAAGIKLPGLQAEAQPTAATPHYANGYGPLQVPGDSRIGGSYSQEQDSGEAQYVLPPDGGVGGGRYSSRDENEIPLDAGGHEIPDITGKLDGLMYRLGEKYKDVPNVGLGRRGLLFYNLVRNGAPYDLKNQPGWQSPLFIYDGNVVRNDVPGNINYGYLGKVFDFPDWLLRLGAGGAQILAGTSKPEWLNLDNFGDDPEDTKRIYQGIDIYNRRNLWKREIP